MEQGASSEFLASLRNNSPANDFCLPVTIPVSNGHNNNGNMLSGDGRVMTYNAFNKPLTIAKNGVTSTFSYGANLLRYKQIKTGLSGGTQTTYYVDKLLEIEKQGSRTTYRHYFDGVAVLHKETVGTATTWTLGFNLKDRLGSVITLADENGDVLEHRSYDPFGKPRRGDFIDAGTIQSAIALDPHPEYRSDPLTDRGFTDHEHLDEQQIIHMNGRVFDYNIGRFTSVDPFISDPTSSQSINPYSYIRNNPLSGTDPSGYKIKEEKVAPTTGSRLKTETKSSDGNGNSVTANRSGRITGMTGKVTIDVKDGVITLGGNNKNEVDLTFEGSIPWKGGSEDDSKKQAATVNAVNGKQSASNNAPDATEFIEVLKAITQRVEDRTGKNTVTISAEEFSTIRNYEADLIRSGAKYIQSPEEWDTATFQNQLQYDGDSAFVAWPEIYFRIEGYGGIHLGANVNYYYQGFVTAAHDPSIRGRFEMSSYIEVYNIRQAWWRRSLYDIRQIVPAKLWARNGYDYYEGRKGASQ